MAPLSLLDEEKMHPVNITDMYTFKNPEVADLVSQLETLIRQLNEFHPLRNYWSDLVKGSLIAPTLNTKLLPILSNDKLATVLKNYNTQVQHYYDNKTYKDASDTEKVKNDLKQISEIIEHIISILNDRDTTTPVGGRRKKRKSSRRRKTSRRRRR